KIPRPKNSFIFYLQDKTPSFLKINPNINRREVSREVGKMWRNETEEVKKYYAEKARIELENHKLK
ncbi:mating-type protein MAT1-2, partial [Anaeromyces robustus]